MDGIGYIFSRHDMGQMIAPVWGMCLGGGL